MEPRFDFSTDEREQLKKLQRVLRIIKQYSKQFPISYLEGFLEIALKQGLGSTEYAERLDETKGNGSRILGVLGKRNRRNEQVLNWVDQIDDEHDSRKTHYFISNKGNILIKKILKEMER